MKQRSHTKDLVSIHSYHSKLAREIDEAEWIGSFDEADALRREYNHITELRNKGDVWYPLF